MRKWSDNMKKWDRQERMRKRDGQDGMRIGGLSGKDEIGEWQERMRNRDCQDGMRKGKTKKRMRNRDGEDGMGKLGIKIG